MIRSNIKKQFSCDRNKLWNIITDNSQITLIMLGEVICQK